MQSIDAAGEDDPVAKVQQHVREDHGLDHTMPANQSSRACAATVRRHDSLRTGPHPGGGRLRMAAPCSPPTVVVMLRRLTALLTVAMAFGLLAAAPALASLSDEVAAGQSVAARLHSGQASCQNLSSSDAEHLGEYVMDRMVGSRATHEAMNARMDAMMGATNGDRMHQALGRRYAGCTTTGSGSGMMGSGAMMGGGSTGAGGWGAMMGSGYAWMRGGTWRHMSHGDWGNAGASMMGSGWKGDSGGGWSTAAVIGVVLGALALGGLVAYVLLRRRPWRRHPSQPTAA